MVNRKIKHIILITLGLLVIAGIIDRSYQLFHARIVYSPVACEQVTADKCSTYDDCSRESTGEFEHKCVSVKNVEKVVNEHKLERRACILHWGYISGYSRTDCNYNNPLAMISWLIDNALHGFPGLQSKSGN